MTWRISLIDNNDKRYVVKPAASGADESSQAHATRLTCYSEAGFDDDLRAEARRGRRVQLVGLERLYE